MSSFFYFIMINELYFFLFFIHFYTIPSFLYGLLKKEEERERETYFIIFILKYIYRKIYKKNFILELYNFINICQLNYLIHMNKKKNNCSQSCSIISFMKLDFSYYITSFLYFP